MKLVDELEAAAKSCSIVEEDDDVMAAYAITTSNYWPRIRLALLAGEEMAEWMSDPGCEHGNLGECRPCAMLARFRAATEGTK